VQQVRAPIYATRLTRGLIEVRLREHHLLEGLSCTPYPHDELEVGIPSRWSSFASATRSLTGWAWPSRPRRPVVHSGDFKFDQTPVNGRGPILASWPELSRQGVHVLLSDSTNAETDGQTPSERVVGETFDQIFARATGRIIVATFASNISRVQQVIDMARKYRRAGIVGRSMVN
jgi:ribonuclease J